MKNAWFEHTLLPALTSFTFDGLDYSFGANVSVGASRDCARIHGQTGTNPHFFYKSWMRIVAVTRRSHQRALFVRREPRSMSEIAILHQQPSCDVAKSMLLHHPIRLFEHRGRDGDTDRLSCLLVHDQLIAIYRLHR